MYKARASVKHGKIEKTTFFFRNPFCIEYFQTAISMEKPLGNQAEYL